ncbi:MAG: adenylate/guanylate cyclase domain-containing protein [Planctomycetaceae bacterium]|nr:adenylate/guanylate cyclase domain-containing protein [Planctomycetaceae bacterium]
MFHLTAQGAAPRQRWRNSLEANREYFLGRSIDCELPVPWETMLSRRHCRLEVIGGALHVKRLPSAANPIFYKGEEVEGCNVLDGEQFVVGNTAFLFQEVPADTPSPNDQPFQEFLFTEQELRQVRFEDADRRMEVLSRLPTVIGEVRSRDEMAAQLLNLILAGIRHADAAAMVSKNRDDHVSIIRWDRRSEIDGMVRPSTRLVRDAMHQRRSILHVWEKTSQQSEGSDYTAIAEFDWAFCTPVRTGGEECWGLYIAGRLDHPLTQLGNASLNLQADVRFTEIVAEIISTVERQNNMEGQLSVLRQFLSPPILAALESTADEEGVNSALLEPRECDVTVLFCDLRGFSHKAEESAHDLRGLLDRVSAALEVMTEQILKHGGVTGDFLGDAVLGFWGWPFASDDAPLKACRAALAIRKAFAEIHANPKHPLRDFQMGIGVAHGRAVAGKIGTRDRVTVTVFGPVVNLASRLEGLTRRLHAGILLDASTTNLVRGRFSNSEGRFRQLAQVLPYGLESPLLVTELLPPEQDDPSLTDADIATYERGVEAFIAGDWDTAYTALHQIPSSDRAHDFLLALIAQHNRRAPVGWQGVIEMSGK